MHAAHATQLFQSDASLAVGQARAAKAQRTAQGAEYGYPIWLGAAPSPLPDGDGPATSGQRDLAGLAERAAGADGGMSKVIAAHMPSAALPMIWTAESGRLARGTDLEAGALAQQLRGHGGPVSGMASMSVAPGRTLLFTSSWDAHIRVWAANGQARPSPVAVVQNAGSDMLKSLHVDATAALLLSGGSDRAVRAWNLAPLVAWAAALDAAAWKALGVDAKVSAPVPTLYAAVASHTRPVIALAALPPPPPDVAVMPGVPTHASFSADSMGRLLEIHWNDGRGVVARELSGHETGIQAVVPVWRECDDGRYTADVWTASSDQTVRRFPLSAHARGAVLPGRVSHAGPVQGAAAAVTADVRLDVPGGVRSVLPLRGVASAEDVVLVGTTGGDIQVWHAGADAPPELAHALEGHWHEVTYLGVWQRDVPWIVSSSLDGTVRRWPLSRVLAPLAPPPSAGPSLLTAEEEAELAELLSDDEL